MHTHKQGLFRAAMILLVVGLIASFTLVHTSASATTLLKPTADTLVRSDFPTSNYGTWAVLRVDGSPLVHSYLRFTVSGLSGISSAKLRIYANSASTSGLTASRVASNVWNETGLNWSNAPAFGSSFGTSAAVKAATWITFDVTSYVTGNGTFSFGLSTPGPTAISLASRESGTYSPQLVLTSGSVSTPVPPTRTPTKPPIATSPSPCNSPIVFNDDFDGSALNTSLWSTQYGSGGGGEQQYYGPNAFSFGNSILSIIATKTPANGYPYTSGIIQTRGKYAQLYGRFEIKTKIPKGQGYWPAFWILPATPDFPVEVDVFENLGKDTHTIYMTNHYKGTNGSNQSNGFGYYSPVDLSADFHTYTLDWSSTRLTWYLDGKQVFTTTQNIPHVPMFIIANLAVGGHWGGNPDSTTVFPGLMQIQYVRAYAKPCN